MIHRYFNKTFVLLFIGLFQQVLCQRGYILYCPCMGRFGNQADHFLGALGFAKGINRTLVLPPWVEYRQGESKSIQVPFETYFKVSEIQKYHDVITMEHFMATLAPNIWPSDKRVSFCYVERGSSGSCNAKEGNPFGPFWDTFNVDFIGSEIYGPLQFDVYRGDMAAKWNKKYPVDEWPVIAFVGAPASFPVQIENRELQKYLVWSNNIQTKAKEFIQRTLPRGGFIGIHLRNGIDWVRACEHIQHSPNLFAAPQCLGYRNENGVVTQEICYPSPKTITKKLKRIIRSMADVTSVFVASDSNHMINDLRESLKRMKIEVHKLDEPNPHVDLAILGRSNHFIGNCVSSYSAFVKRERDVNGFKSSFWAFPTEKSESDIHDEL